jgi:hypothetical protein
MAFTTFMALALFCAGSAITMLWGENQSAKSHPWLIPTLGALTGIFAAMALASARWFRGLFTSQEKIADKTIEQSTTGANSPAMAVGSIGDFGSGNTVKVGSETHHHHYPTVELLAEPKGRPRVKPVSYNKVDQVTELMTGYAEFLLLAQEGEAAHHVEVGFLTIGDWTVSFQEIPMLQGTVKARMDQIKRVVWDGDTPRHEYLQTLDAVWRHVEKERGKLLGKQPIRVSYTDFKGKPFRSVCSIERDLSIRHGLPFRIADYEELLP